MTASAASARPEPAAESRRGRHLDREPDPRPTARPIGDPRPAAVGDRDPRHQREPEPEPTAGRRRERAEGLAAPVRGDPGPRVVDLDGDLTGAALDPDGDGAAAVDPGVVEQV